MDEHEGDPAGKKMPTALKQQQATRPDRQTGGGTTDWIRNELRKVFDETLNEPVPERLRVLLTKLREDENDGGDEGQAP